MADFSSLQTKVNDLKAKVEQNSISPVYLGNILDEFIASLRDVDMTALEPSITTAIENAKKAIDTALSALSTAKSANDAATAASQTATSASNTANEAKTISLKAKNAADAAKEVTDSKGMPDGIASLDESGCVPMSQLPDEVNDIVPFARINNSVKPSILQSGTTGALDVEYLTSTKTFVAKNKKDGLYYSAWLGSGAYGGVSSANGVTPALGKLFSDANNAMYRYSADKGLVNIEQSAIDAQSDIDGLIAEKGAPNGIATLDEDGIVPMLQLPSEINDIVRFNRILNGMAPSVQQLGAAGAVEIEYVSATKTFVAKSKSNGKYYATWLGSYTYGNGSSNGVTPTLGKLYADDDNNMYKYDEQLGIVSLDDLAVKLNQMRGKPNGLATLDNSGFVNISQFPSDVFDVVEFSRLLDSAPGSDVINGSASDLKEVIYDSTSKRFLAVASDGKIYSDWESGYEYGLKSDSGRIPSVGKIYVNASTNVIYRYNGSVLVSLQNSLSLGQSEGEAFPGDVGAELLSTVASLQGYMASLMGGANFYVNCHQSGVPVPSTLPQALTVLNETNRLTNFELGGVLYLITANGPTFYRFAQKTAPGAENPGLPYSPVVGDFIPFSIAERLQEIAEMKSPEGGSGNPDEVLLLKSRLDALEKSVWPLDVSLTVTPEIVEVSQSPVKITAKWAVMRNGQNVIENSIVKWLLPAPEVVLPVGSSTKSVTITPSAEGDTDMSVQAQYGDLTATAVAKVKAVYPSFFGKIPAQGDVSAQDVSALSKGLKASKHQQYDNIVLNNERIVFAYPQSFGELAEIRDINGLLVTDAYNRSSLVINDVPYYCYAMIEARTTSNVSISFS